MLISNGLASHIKSMLDSAPDAPERSSAADDVRESLKRQLAPVRTSARKDELAQGKDESN